MAFNRYQNGHDFRHVAEGRLDGFAGHTCGEVRGLSYIIACVFPADFRKPVEIYGVLGIFGPNMLASHGKDWKRQRRIVGSSFSERSNALVFEESVRQMEGLLRCWASLERNSRDEMGIADVAPWMANVALHVICGAGFGVPQTWPGEDEEVLG